MVPQPRMATVVMGWGIELLSYGGSGGDQGGQGLVFGGSRRVGAPGEADGTPGGGGGKGAEDDVGVVGDAGVDGHAGEEGDAEAACDHLHEGVESRGGEAFLFCPEAAEGEGLVSEAVTVFEEEHAFVGEGAGGDAGPRGEAMAFGEGDHELVAGDGEGFGAAAVAGEGDEEEVEAVRCEAIDEGAGGVFADEKAESREGGSQSGHEAGEEEGADGGDDAEAQRSGEGGAGSGCGFGDGLEGGHCLAGAGDDFLAEGGEDDVLAGGAVENGGVELAFEGEDAGRQG